MTVRKYAMPEAAGDASAASLCTRGHRVSNDPYLHARAPTGWQREVVQLSPGAFLGRVSEIGSSGFFAAEEFASRSLFHIGPAYAGGLTLGLAESRLDGAGIWNGRRVCDESVLCLPGNHEMVLRSYEGCRVWWLFVPWQGLGDDCRSRFASAVASGVACLCLKDGALAARLRACIKSVHSLADGAATDGRSSEDLQAVLHGDGLAIAREFASRYLAESPRLGFREAHAMRILWQVREFLRRNVGEVIGLPDLCEAASASERTVRNACELITGESPMAFLRAMRLNQVRRSLLNIRNPVTVTEIGMRWGFLHMPQFSKDYRQLFGELPSATIRRQLGDGP